MSEQDSAPMVLSRGGYAALMRVLLEQDDLQVVDIQSEPVQVGAPSANRFYRLWLTAQGQAGQFEMTLILKVFPDLTWSEVWNPAMDGPAELVLLESDLLTSLPPGILDPTIASARAREGKPGWTMTTDFLAELGVSASDRWDAASLRLILLRLAELHALHWGALEVLDYVYPWLTRQAEWLHRAAALYSSILAEVVPDDPAGELLLDEQPQASAALRGLMARLTPADQAALSGFLADPDWLIERLRATPITVCHGAPHIGHLALVEESRVVLIEWEAMQVAPSSWDVWTFWDSLPQPALTEADALGFYLDTLEQLVGPIDRAAWQASYRLAPVVAFVLRDLPEAGRLALDATPPDEWLARAAHVAGLIRS
ncbi:MAG: hypothetical protein KIT87_18090 [Anaerolineae bacterium]|nr:hypothetical protein [Anaerolineae bacterium]